MEQKFSQTPDSEFGKLLAENSERAQSIIDELDMGVQIEQTISLGYDSAGTYFGLIQKVSNDQGLEKTIAGIYSMITVQNRFLFFYLWDVYSGDVDEIDELLETTKWFSNLQHEVN
jgi:hypothetical protein